MVCLVGGVFGTTLEMGVECNVGGVPSSADPDFTDTDGAKGVTCSATTLAGSDFTDNVSCGTVVLEEGVVFTGEAETRTSRSSSPLEAFLCSWVLVSTSQIESLADDSVGSTA